MNRSFAICSLSLLLTAGCGQLRPVPPPIMVGQQIVTVSGDAPFIELEDGIRINVDDVSPGQSVQIKVTKYIDIDGNKTIEMDTVSESIPELEQP